MSNIVKIIAAYCIIILMITSHDLFCMKYPQRAPVYNPVKGLNQDTWGCVFHCLPLFGQIQLARVCKDLWTCYVFNDGIYSNNGYCLDVDKTRGFLNTLRNFFSNSNKEAARFHAEKFAQRLCLGKIRGPITFRFFSPDQYYHFLGGISNNRYITSLNLSYNFLINDLTLDKLAISIENPTSCSYKLQSLILRDVFITHDSIGNLLNKLPQLTHLDISSNWILHRNYDRTTHQWTEATNDELEKKLGCHMNNLITLVMAESGIVDSNTGWIVKLLENSKKLQELDLSNNNIRRNGNDSLLRAANRCDSPLKILDLSDNLFDGASRYVFQREEDLTVNA